MHAINCLMLPLEIVKQIFMYRQSRGSCNRESHTQVKLSFIVQQLALFIMKYVVNPILVGLILYGSEAVGGGENNYGVRVCIAFSLINTSLLFLASIGTLPFIGCYTNLITKVASQNYHFCQSLVVSYLKSIRNIHKS